MGTFIITYGVPSIPEDKLSEFRARTLAIADQGGMMTLTILGRHLTLLSPVGADEDGHLRQAGGDVAFGPEMESWLMLLRQEHQKLVSYPGPLPANYAEVFVSTLDRTAEIYRDAFFFTDAFHYFIAHSEHRDIQGLILLTGLLVEGYRPGGKLLQCKGWTWDVNYSRNNDNFGAYAIKLFFAVLGNPALRQRIFKI